MTDQLWRMGIFAHPPSVVDDLTPSGTAWVGPTYPGYVVAVLR